jgi:hypothetical protein
MTFEKKVHDTIMGILATAAMPVVTFANSDGSAFVAMTVDEGTTKVPVEAETGPTQYINRPRESKNLVGSFVDEIDHINWQAFVVYPTRVAVEGLVESFSRTVAASGAQRQFDLRLIDVSVEHPPRNQPNNGSHLILQIEVHPAPA